MEGKFAILDTSGTIIAIYEGDINYHDVSQYENYGGEIKVYDYRGTPLIGGTYNAIEDKFE